jgi:hypothetical protein
MSMKVGPPSLLRTGTGVTADQDVTIKERIDAQSVTCVEKTSQSQQKGWSSGFIYVAVDVMTSWHEGRRAHTFRGLRNTTLGVVSFMAIDISLFGQGKELDNGRER